ncbi:MAG TPA: hypothetical protein VF988_04295 [Verrucomicrobiae bacterium]
MESDANLKAALKQYRKDVPTVGTIDSATVDQYLTEGRICREWTIWDGRKQFFHIIKSPGSYPEKSVFYGNSEQDVFQMTIRLGMQHGIDLKDLLTG